MSNERVQEMAQEKVDRWQREAGPQPGLTVDEVIAMETTATLANQIRRIIGNGPTAEADWREAAYEIHVIQHRIMAQAAARCYPNNYRLMGQSLRDSTPAPSSQETTP